MHTIYAPTRAWMATLLVLGLSLSGLSAAQQDNAAPFIRDAKAGSRRATRPGRWAVRYSAARAGSGATLADELEYNVGLVWTLKQKGSTFDGLRIRARLGWVTDKAPAGDARTTDLRIDLNLPITLL